MKMSVAMGCKHFLLLCATLALYCTVRAQSPVKAPSTRFTCTGRGSGYYADVETGCQVYHMCDGLGRQFSYTCPNTTLFQQRMLICDHWYMVNCSMSERDYSANLLIGQRDKPFVSDEEMQFRTPRPDILSVPAGSNYYDGLREAETKFGVHPGNSIVGVADSISSANNNGLDSAKQNYRPPTSWSTGTGVKGRPDSTNTANTRPTNNQRPNNGPSNTHPEDQDTLTGAASQRPGPTFQPTPEHDFTQNTGINNITPPTQHLSPPFPPPTTEPPTSDEYDIDVRMKTEPADPVVTFIKRFDPNSPDSHKTAMTKTEILNLNQHLPAGQTSAEDERTPRKNKNVGNNFNRVENDKKGFNEGSRFDSVNTKPSPVPTESDSRSNGIASPGRELLPPKSDYSNQPTSTMGPPIYYEWKWAAPAFDLEPPKQSNATNSSSVDSPQGKRNVEGRSPFSAVTRPTPADLDPIPPTKNTEYNISSYFVPDYVFPLDKPHPGYENDEAQTSFQVKVARPGRASYGENPSCPQCHPGYVVPGTCEPCIVKR